MPELELKNRGYGVVWTLKRFGYRAVRRLLRLKIARLFVLDFAPMCETSSNAAGFEFRFLSADEIRTAASDPANDLDANLAERLASGRDFCFGALDGGRLANYSWYALGYVEPEHSFGVSLSLPADVAYMYKAFTVPAYRGHRLHQATIHHAVAVLTRMGIRRLAAIVEYGDWASLRSHARMGCRQAGWFCLMGRRPIYWRSGPKREARASFCYAGANSPSLTVSLSPASAPGNGPRSGERRP